MKSPKPTPVPTNIICSICDEPWGLHQEVNGEVSTLECIRLLKAKRWTPTITVNPRPWVYPVYPTWPYTTTITCGVGQNVSTSAAHTVTNSATPAIAMASAAV